MATHVFGNPCDIESIEAVAKKHDLKVIYDAAHCFGVTYKSRSVFDYGDISTCSFHATKLFHTGEGGALFCNHPHLENRVFYLHNFGHMGKEAFQGEGINGKISELQAAMGLAVFPYMDQILRRREEIVNLYKKELVSFKTIRIREGTAWNYSYFPLIFNSEEQLKTVTNALNEAEIYPRRYFYPSLNKLPYVEAGHCMVSEEVARQILCLPLYHDLKSEEVVKICSIINQHT